MESKETVGNVTQNNHSSIADFNSQKAAENIHQQIIPNNNESNQPFFVAHQGNSQDHTAVNNLPLY